MNKEQHIQVKQKAEGFVKENFRDLIVDSCIFGYNDIVDKYRVLVITRAEAYFLIFNGLEIEEVNKIDYIHTTEIKCEALEKEC